MHCASDLQGVTEVVEAVLQGQPFCLTARLLLPEATKINCHDKASIHRLQSTIRRNFASLHFVCSLPPSAEPITLFFPATYHAQAPSTL